MKLLFVCTGNICRSLMAQRLAVKLAAERGLDLEARSAGVAAERWFKPPEHVWKALAADGLSPAPHTPQLVSRELLAWADKVLVMTRRHAEALRDAYPEHGRKIALLAEGDIADPMGGDVAAFEKARVEILEGLGRVLA